MLWADIRAIWDYLEDRGDVVPCLRRLRCAVLHRRRLIRTAEAGAFASSARCRRCATGWWLS